MPSSVMSNATLNQEQKPPFQAVSARRAPAVDSVARLPIVASATPPQCTKPKRFTLDGSAALESHLEAVCQAVSEGVRRLVPSSSLVGLVLGGGYGRGEGGVLRVASGDLPYNDLEFYVFVRGNSFFAERRYRQALQNLGHRLSPQAGLEVEFKVLTLRKLRRSPTSMFFYDLVSGHRWLIGSEALFGGCRHHTRATLIPLHDGTRLLMNRCSGLLFSAERLQRSDLDSGDLDFIHRNLAKAQLAFGDVLLTAFREYNWSCRERNRRLHRLETPDPSAWRATLRSHHAEGVAFKLHPVRFAGERAELLRRHTELKSFARQLWLWLENFRLSSAFVSSRDYALSTTNKCPKTSATRNRLMTLNHFGPVAALRSTGSIHPRQRLLHALCLLLWEEDLCKNPILLKKVQWELGTEASDFSGLVAAYEALWHRFN